MKLPVLYISYNGLGEPLVHSQVLPYLGGLARAGYPITLMTFERTSRGPDYSQQRDQALEQLNALGIGWRGLVYHRSLTLLATAFDIVRGFVCAVRIIRQSGVKMVHARSYVPALIASWLKRSMRVRFVFDMRGLMADEYVDAGNWKRNGLLYRVTKRMEKRLLHSADEIVVLTERVKNHLAQVPGLPSDLAERITVIPCCVDENRFRRSDSAHGQGSTQAQPQNGPVLVYSGSVGTWYLLDEMLDFFAAGLSQTSGLTLLILNQREQALIRRTVVRKGIDASRVMILAVGPDEVPAHLSRADIGLSFIKPTFSKSASSPTKFAEYLAMGLPVVVNRGVGDLDAIVQAHQVGVVVDGWSPNAYARAWQQVWRLLEDRSIPDRCRRVAEEHFSVQVAVARYQAVYARVATV